jgi:type I restriction enzyme M protein
MSNISSIIKNVRNIMRDEDPGISGDAQRLEQLGWMLFLKILDERDQALEIIRDDYTSVIPERFQWRNWATDPEGITGDELLNFINHPTEGLFPKLTDLRSAESSDTVGIIREVFDKVNNYMKSGYAMRKVINQLNGFDFNNSEDRHIFGTIYESILNELRDAGTKGEFYTPRAITQLMTLMTNPQLGEVLLDPAAGTGGFLTAAIDYIREHSEKTLENERILQKSICGWEYKPVPYVLGLTNLILHGLEVPDWHCLDSLKKEYNSIGPKQQVDLILANPPFGAGIAEGVETNFPASFRCKESADLFVILMLQLLKPRGRCAIVLPDGCITGDGYKIRIREKLLTDCNLHTIVRLPQSTFHPATVSTNLLFFEKGTPTKDIWYYEHKLPEGQKSYSKTKVIQFEEFGPMIEWWGQREESEVAWKVNVEDLKECFDLDVKNPSSSVEEDELTVKESLEKFRKSMERVSAALESVEKEYAGK